METRVQEPFEKITLIDAEGQRTEVKARAIVLTINGGKEVYLEPSADSFPGTSHSLLLSCSVDKNENSTTHDCLVLHPGAANQVVIEVRSFDALTQRSRLAQSATSLPAMVNK